jgi:hypothetical protein
VPPAWHQGKAPASRAASRRSWAVRTSC